MKPHVVFAFAVILSLPVGVNKAIANGGTKARPRYTLPKDGRQGKIELDQYFQMGDLDEAGRLLLSEAELSGLEVDYKYEGLMPELLLQSGKITPPSRDLDFLKQDSPARASISDDRVTLLKFSRSLSIRELSEILRSGIRLYRGIPYNAFIARIPESSIEFLASLSALQWTGEYLASYKYDPKLAVEGKCAVLIYTLPGDKAESRHDLQRLGATVHDFSSLQDITYRYEYYVAEVHGQKIPDVASLWWVQKIERAPVFQFEGSDETDSLQAPTFVGQMIRPNDSRRLIGWSSRRLYSGNGQTVLIMDNGCDYWDHNELRTKVLAQPSNAPGWRVGCMDRQLF